MQYSIDYEKIKKTIKKEKPDNVLLQLPDGLKQYYEKIVQELKGDYNLFLWSGSCFGACDIPVFAEKSGIDIIIHFGHEEFTC